MLVIWFPCRGKRLYTRDRHLRIHRGFSVAFSNGCSLAFFNAISLVSCIFQRIVIFPEDVHWNCPMAFQWHFPVDFHVCDSWCEILCPDLGSRPGRDAKGAARDRPSWARLACFCSLFMCL